MTDQEKLIAELEDAAGHLDLKRGEEVAAAVIEDFRSAVEPWPEKSALRVLRVMRRKCWFSLLERTVDAYLQRSSSLLVRTLRAQALIDQGQLAAGLAVVEDVKAKARPESREAEEARGLIGRVYKQAFVKPAPRVPVAGAEALRRAIDAYHEAYRLARLDRMWPGVNLLALQARAERDGVAVDSRRPVAELAKEILEMVKDEEEARERKDDHTEQPWLLATGLEASLAAGQPDDVVYWAKRYLNCRTADAFELGSTARQLREIWKTDQSPDPKIGSVLGQIEAVLLQRGGGMVNDATARGTHLSGVQLQEVWGLERFKSRDWLDRGLRASDAVGRVHDVNGEPVGSGFLLNGRDLHLALGDRQIFVTNFHVINQDPSTGCGIRPRDARIRFTTHDGEDQAPGVPVAEILWSSPVAQLDVAVVTLQRPVKKNVAIEVGDISELQTRDPPSRIYVVGHPKGEALFYSLYDNELVSLERPLVRYRSPTLDGSSGSPLLDHRWRLVGIHRHADHERKVNGGSLFGAVAEAFHL